jgi:glucose/arabinose dehydrogenase
MKKAVGVFFLLNLFSPFLVFAQDGSVGVPADYRATLVLDNLKNSNQFTFDFSAKGGSASGGEDSFIITQTQGGATQIVKVAQGGAQTVLLDHASQPITGLSFHSGQVYVTMRGRVAILRNGKLSDIISGLPAAGDYGNSSVIFQDGRMYFSVGTATNAGVVGPDNLWLASSPSTHDLACRLLKINQTNFSSNNVLMQRKGTKASTGPFQPFNTQAYSDTVLQSEKCNGSILSANPDGSNLRTEAFGFHNPKGMSFDTKGNLYALDQAMEDRGSRPVKNGRDSLFKVSSGTWYGWPDYNGGVALDSSIIKDIPNLPPKPGITFDPGLLSQFLINQFIPNSGLAINGGTKVSQFGLDSNTLTDFVSVPKDYKITQIKFGPDDNLYMLINNGKNSQLWKIERMKKTATAVLGISENRSLPLAWSISLTVMVVGMLAAYLVYHNHQQGDLGI